MEFQYVAIGRLHSEDGVPVAGKHVIIASACAQGGNEKAFKEQVMNLMDQGGQKLLDKTTDKVTRLKAADTSLWVAFHQDDNLMIGFFAVSELFKQGDNSTDTTRKIEHLRKTFLKGNNTQDLMSAKAGGGVHKANLQLLTSVLSSDDKLKKAQQKAQQAIDVQRDNIGILMKNTEKLDDLNEKAEKLETNAATFKKGATKIHRQMWWQNCRMNLMIGGAVLVVIVIIIIAVVASKK